MLSLRNVRCRWVSTVFSVTNSACAIYRLPMPAAAPERSFEQLRGDRELAVSLDQPR
jgi:hypothetical protein